LLSNAIKYNRAKGSVSVATHAPRGGRLLITVTDTGRGIRVADLPRLFVPFERLGVSDVDGIGLGLSLAQQLARAMSGEITAASVVDEGSTFTFDLPSVGATSREQVPTTKPHLDARRYVVHIDSDVENLDLVDHIVSKRKAFTVVTAATGSVGIELARQGHPALVVVNLYLPDMSGERVRAALRADIHTADIPVIVLNTGPVDVAALLGVLDDLPIDVLAGARR
jgi:CheY-like chemotaxis protein